MCSSQDTLSADYQPEAPGFDAVRPPVTEANRTPLEAEDSRFSQPADYQREHERYQVEHTLRDVLSMLNANRPLADTLDFVLAAAVRHLQATGGAVFQWRAGRERLLIQAAHFPGLAWPDGETSFPTGEGPIGRALQDTTRLVLPQLSAKDGMLLPGGPYGALLVEPLQIENRPYGVLVIFYDTAHSFSNWELDLTNTIADQIMLSIQNARLRRHARQAGIVEERERLARELHDSVTQSLYSLTLFAEAGRELARTNDLTGVSHQLNRIGETSQQALKELRLLIHHLRPPALQDAGLVGALRQRLEAVEERSGVEAHFSAEDWPSLPTEIDEELYWIAQEALNNALKHASADTVRVYLRQEESQLEMEVTDDGRGFAADEASAGGMGLANMRQRAEGLGAGLTVDSQPGRGTRILVRLSPPQ